MIQLIENPDLLEEIQQINLEDALQLAIRLHQANQHEHAEDIYRKLLELDSENPNTLHFLGLLRHERGYSEEGVGLINKALELAPDYIDAKNNLGNIYLQMGHPELAESCLRCVIDTNPNFVTAYGNLGVALNQLGHHHDAVEYLLKAIDFQPNNPYHYQNLGNIYCDLQNYRDAVGIYNKSLELKPDAKTYRKLNRTFYMMGKIEHCIDVLKQWLKYDPENPTALHLYAAYTSTNAPPRASDAYIRETFDGFASSFDGVLQDLDYQAPFLIQKALQQVNPDFNSWHLLDVGCGTGLCGALVKPMVKHLIGVDLSSKMLERAHARKIYDELIEAELTAFCSDAKSAYHVITCVDTFCYFGDLTSVMQAAVCALKPKGWFIFTLEKQEESDSIEGFNLNIHGRYSHTETYLRNVLSNAGFRVHSINNAVLRKERNNDVMGLVVTANAP